MINIYSFVINDTRYSYWVVIGHFALKQSPLE